MPLSSGTRVGPHEILAPLGSGGMGDVYRARDTRLGRDVAIKTLPAAFAADPERLARFRREAQTLAALNHPNIAAIYGLEESEGSPLLVLELVEGETLATRLARGALPLSETLRIGGEIAAAIEAAHERGIVHRDLKPGNVIITPRGTAKVLDFGLAKSDAADDGPGSDSSQLVTRTHVDATVAGTVLGTAAYMSPEQARGLAVDRRSDVWSFGCVLFECLAGRRAFQGNTVSDLIARILEREPDWSALPSGTPPRVREVLRRCLCRDAEARPRDIRDVRLELATIASGAARAAAVGENAIAVLPFNNLSGPDDEYFADGVTDEILNALAQVEGLRVAARTSCFAFKGHREDLRTIGEKLEVATLLEGTVRRSGARLRITAQLVNVADGYQLWSERYDREMTDVFQVQDEIAGAIAARLRGQVGHKPAGAGRGGTANLDAYEAFLKGRALLLRRGRSIRQAIPHLERAVALDPAYGEAMAWLADAYRLAGTMGIGDPMECMPRAKATAEQALAVAPDLPEAYATIGSVEAQFARDHARASVAWQRALMIDPRHVRSRGERAMWSVGLGAMSPDQAARELEQAVADEPHNAWAAAIHSFMLGFAGRHDEAVAEAGRAVAIDPESHIARWMQLHALCCRGDDQVAFAMLPDMLASSGRDTWSLTSMAWLRARTGQADAARAAFDEMEARSRFEFVGPFWLAAAASAAGLPDLAFRYAERAVAERDPLVVIARQLPQWNAIRNDPRFPALAAILWQ